MDKYFLHPGYIFASKTHTMISTVLGSCISICLWDKKGMYGGMNHFIYPKGTKETNNGKFGNASCKYLITLMLDLGSQREDLVAHVVGGSRNPLIRSSIGKDNARIAEKILKKNDIPVSILDVGGEVGRKLIFNTATGEILVHKGATLREGDWYRKN
jgi:chemotaxis protein CheD